MRNTTGNFLRLLHISPTAGGSVYPYQEKADNLNILDGFGGESLIGLVNRYQYIAATI